MKFLFINDDGEWLKSLARCLGGFKNVFFAECHSVKDGLRAIEKHQPDVIFLDHSLTEGGDEGLEIAKKIKDKVRLYSTTADKSQLVKYQEAGIQIEHLGAPINLKKLRSIITGGETNGK